MWQWSSREHAQAAVTLAHTGQIPEAGAAFALTSDVTTEFTDVVDDR
jgi:hypothetical protein